MTSHSVLHHETGIETLADQLNDRRGVRRRYGGRRTVEAAARVTFQSLSLNSERIEIETRYALV